MTAGFFFDTFLLKKDNKFYGMTLTYDFLKERYLKYYDKLIVSTRCKNIEQEKGNSLGYKITEGENVKVIPIKNYNKIPDSILKRKIIKKEIEDILDKCDLAIIRMPSVIGNIACDICRKKNIKYKIEMVACPWGGYTNHKNKYGKIVAPFMFFRTKYSLKKAKEVIYVTEKFLQKRYPSKGKSISCSDVVLGKIDDDILKKRKNKIDRIQKSDKIKLFTIGSLDLKYKGQEYVIKALGELKKEGINNFEYFLIGNGSNEYLKKIIIKNNVQDEVIFLGTIQHKEIFDRIDEMDIYIQSSLIEGLPRAIIEAMSRACPAIGTNAGGIPELINEKYIFKKKDTKGLVKILKNITKDELKEMAKYSFEVAKRYDKKVLENKRRKFYCE